MNLVPTRRSTHCGLLRTLLPEHGTVFCRFRHSFCALSSEDYKVSRLYDIAQNPFENGSLRYPARPRLSWHARLNTPALEKQSTQTRIPFSSNHSTTRRYGPYVQELLNGLWSMDQNPIWILIDDLVATGEPQSSHDTFPEFQQWKHVLMASSFSEAILTLVSQGYIRYHSPLEERDEVVDGDEVGDEGVVAEEGDVQRAPESTSVPVPTWLVAFMLATMPHTQVDAYEGFAFCLSQLDATPTHLRAPLLLFSMCSLSTHKVAVQVPILLGAFHDIFSSTDPDLEAKTDRWQPFGSRETVIYQHNILLTLLSLFPHVPGFARCTIGVLQHMEASGVLLDVDTANKLIACRFASNGLVVTIRDVLERQGMHGTQDQSDELSFALMRFYSRRSNQPMAAEYAETSLQKRPGQYAQAYLRSFRNVAESFAYLRSIEEREQREGTSNKNNIEGARALDRFFSDHSQTVSHSPSAEFRGVTKRHVYSSLLHSVSISKTLSAKTFHDLFITIREAHGDDRELETIAISGMLKRKAWDQAKDLWDQWQTTNRSIRSILREMRSFLERRDRNFGDAGKVRRTLGWSKVTEQVTARRMNMLSVDASALSVVVRALAGPKPDSLASAFATMDGYALKLHTSESRSGNVDYSDLPEPKAATSTEPIEQIQLTSRVINCFMVRAMYFRRPDVVFRLWDAMTSYYGVDSSTTTLDILIRSARLAASMETALTRFTPKWMIFTGGFFRKPVFPNLSAQIMWMLSPDYSPTPRWGGVPAWRMVRRLFREEIIFANFPRLRNVSIPALAVRGDDATGKVEAFKELTAAGGLWGTQARKMGNYPHLVPSARIFREYIVMLGRVHRSSEIPEVLAWMKALNLLPSRRCLSLSLALWSQVGLDSLADDAWGGVMPRRHDRTGIQSSPGHRRHGGEYDKLLAWLENWVGEKNVPEESEVLDAFRYLQELEDREEFLY